MILNYLDHKPCKIQVNLGIERRNSKNKLKTGKIKKTNVCVYIYIYISLSWTQPLLLLILFFCLFLFRLQAPESRAVIMQIFPVITWGHSQRPSLYYQRTQYNLLSCKNGIGSPKSASCIVKWLHNSILHMTMIIRWMTV